MMRTETVTNRIGERVGDIDWSYDFRQHFNNLCTTDERRDEVCDAAKRCLMKVETAYKAGEPIYATTDGGFPKFGYHLVVDVGMYDGWPYWQPTPSVKTLGPLGPEWHSFSFIAAIRSKGD